MRSSIILFILLLIVAISVATQESQQSPPKPIFKFEEVMIPVRDGVNMQTVILTPADQQGPLPILFRALHMGSQTKRQNRCLLQ